MKAAHVPYRSTGYFSKTVLDYLNAEPALDPFYQKRPGMEGLEVALKVKSEKPVNREVLKIVLENQYEQLQSSLNPLVRSNISRLGEENTYTITTGHQLNIFAGPLYTIYKILSVIRLSEDLNSHFSKQKAGSLHIVPVFWMASEDHDFEEINHLNIGDRPISWESTAGGAVGRMSTRDMGPTLGKVLSSLGVLRHSAEIEGICRQAYGTGKTLAEATRYFYNELFGRFGLVIIDGDDAQLKAHFSPIMEQDIFEGNSHRLVTEANRQLECKGYKVQIHPREINFFYLSPGSRERLVKTELDTYASFDGDKNWTAAELKDELGKQPQNFSPNVVMRPLYQEFLLPNLAYIGGGAEVNYWLSLKSTFDHYQIPYPVLLLRNSALLVDQVSDDRMQKLGFTPPDFFENPRSLITRYVRRSTERELDLAKEKTTLEQLMAETERKLNAIDPTLKQSAQALLTRMLDLMEKLEKKMLKAEKLRFDTEMSQILKVHEKLFPNNSLQERFENFLPYYGVYGSNLLDELKSSFSVLENEFTVLFLEN